MYCNEPVSEFPKSKDTVLVHVTNMAVITMFFQAVAVRRPPGFTPFRSFFKQTSGISHSAQNKEESQSLGEKMREDGGQEPEGECEPEHKYRHKYGHGYKKNHESDKRHRHKIGCGHRTGHGCGHKKTS